jgi:hypothetical protein
VRATKAPGQAPMIAFLICSPSRAAMSAIGSPTCAQRTPDSPAIPPSRSAGRTADVTGSRPNAGWRVIKTNVAKRSKRPPDRTGQQSASEPWPAPVALLVSEARPLAVRGLTRSARVGDGLRASGLLPGPVGRACNVAKPAAGLCRSLQAKTSLRCRRFTVKSGVYFRVYPKKAPF